MDRMSPTSALTQLKNGEVCVLVLKGGERREAYWNECLQCFFPTAAPLMPLHRERAIPHDQIDEWWPVNVGR